MARIPYVDPATAPEPVRDAFDKLPAQLNIFRMVANAETCFRPFLSLGSAILVTQKLDALLREHVILRIGKLWDGRYEFHQHVPIAKAFGASDEQIRAHERGEIDAKCFSAVEQAVLVFATEVVEHGKPSDKTFAAVAEHLSPREIVELLLAIGFYSTVAMVTESTAIELDEPLGLKIVESAKS
jgi:alkylhydroperoxidase family enzyme